MPAHPLAPELRPGPAADLGAELFAEEPYESVHIERVAEIGRRSVGCFTITSQQGGILCRVVERSVEHW